MKHLRKFNESIITKEDILDNFAYLNDKLGEAHITTSKFGNSVKWKLVWSLGIDMSVLQDAKNLIQKIKEITEEVDEVISASERFSEYNFNMSLSDRLVIEIVPKDTGETNFKFISKYEYRSLYVYANEIERFFNSYGVRVTKMELDQSYNEITETNDLDIHLSHLNPDAVNRFKELFNQELQAMANEIDREYGVYGNGTIITINPNEEKAGVELTYSL